MHDIKILTFALTLSFFINACGGGNSNTEDSNNTHENSTSSSSNSSSSQNSISIRNCPDETLEIKDKILSGDILQSDEDNTEVKIIHNEDNSKLVCVVSGKASLLRK